MIFSTIVLTEIYDTFINITRNALIYAIIKNNEECDKLQEETLLDAYLHLTHYPEVTDVLNQLKDKKLTVFSNRSHDMLSTYLFYLFG